MKTTEQEKIIKYVMNYWEAHVKGQPDNPWAFAPTSFLRWAKRHGFKPGMIIKQITENNSFKPYNLKVVEKVKRKSRKVDKNETERN